MHSSKDERRKPITAVPDAWQGGNIALHHAYDDNREHRGGDQDDRGYHYGRDDDRGNGHHQHGHDHHPGQGHHYGHDDDDDCGGTGGNTAPVAQDASASGDEDTLISGQVVATDVDSLSLTYALVSGAVDSNGDAVAGLTFNPDGSYSFQGPQDFNGAVSFTYTANDGSLDSNVATVSITVNPVNDAPVAQDASASGDEDTLISGQVVATDVDSPSLTYALVSGAVDGNGDPVAGLTFNPDGSYSFQGPQDFNGAVSFTYTANDGSLDSNVATVSITVNPVNDAPVAQDASASGDEDTLISGQVVATDVDSPSLTYALVSGAVDGNGDPVAGLTFNPDGSYSFQGPQDFNGAVSFTYTANDGSLDSNVATVSITVNPVNDAPVAQDASAAGDEDTLISGQVVATDVDSLSLTYALVSGAVDGNDDPVAGLTFNPDGSYSFQGPQDFNGAVSFTYTANDGSLDSNVATVSITVNPVNDAPVTTNDAATTDEDTAVSGTVADNTTDPDNLASDLTYSVVGAVPTGLSFNKSDGTWMFDPSGQFDSLNDGDSTEVTFQYRANDGTDDSNISTVAITINGVNETPPEVSLTLAGQVTHDETAGLQSFTPLDNDPSDPNNDGNDVAGADLPSDILALFNAIAGRGSDPDIDAANKDNGAIGFAGAQVVSANVTPGSSAIQSTVLTLGIDTAVASGLATTEGDPITLELREGGQLVVGVVAGGAHDGEVAIAAAIGQDGTVYLAQYLSLLQEQEAQPPGFTSYDESVAFAPGSIFAVATVTAEGAAPVAQSVDISQAIHVEDDGPTITVAPICEDSGAGQGFAPAGDDFIVNSTIAGGQHNASAAGLTNGTFVVAWDDGSSGNADIRARVVGADGSFVNLDFGVNTTTTLDQIQPSVGALENGGFVAVWADPNASTDGSSTAVVGRIFNANGSAASPVDFLINSTTYSTQTNPYVAGLSSASTVASGGFVVVYYDYSHQGTDSSGFGLRGRLFDASGSPIANDFEINTTTPDSQVFAKVAGLVGGGFVVTWTDFGGGDGDGWAVRGRVYDGNGDAVNANDFVVDTTFAGDQGPASVTALQGGGFVVVWEDQSLAIRGRVFDADGVSVSINGSTDDFIIANSAFGELNPSVAGLPDGGFVVTWETNASGERNIATSRL